MLKLQLLLAAFLATLPVPQLDEAPLPPVAHAEPHAIVTHGRTRIDEYYWLRDDDRSDPEVLSYLDAENRYTEAMLAPVAGLQRDLYEEMAARIDPEDRSVPVRLGDYWYYRRFDRDRDYPIIARRRGGPQGPEEPEQILIDGNARAAGHTFYRLGHWQVSEDGNLFAFAEDTVGREEYAIRILDLRSGELLPDEIAGVTSYLAWANDNATLFYVRMDDALRPYRVHRHTLGDEEDPLVYEEADNRFYLYLYKSRSRQFVIIGLQATLSTETILVDANHPAGEPLVFLPREAEHRYSIDPVGPWAWVRSNWNAPNYRILRVPLANSADKSAWGEFLAEREDVMIEDFAAFEEFIAVEEVHAGSLKLRVIPLGQSEDFYVEHDEQAYTAAIGDNPNVDTALLRYVYSSLATPTTTYDLHMQSRDRQWRKREFAGGDFDPNVYVTRRVEAPARDGTPIPVTMLYRLGTQPDGTRPLYLVGYGAYGVTYFPEFDRDALSLVDRGFIYAIAHVRGGQEFGRRWYDAGRTQHKKNTFTDFIDAARYLVRSGWAAPDKVVGSGVSAGGLLIGAVANMSPDTFAALVAGVPFVDVVTTMLDETIPLTSFEFDEWGNPAKREDYDYMLSYSPYDQVRERNYPHMLVTAGLWDARVQYWEPAKWVARLRARKTGDNLLLLYTDMSAGHAGQAGRYQRLHDTAREYAFLLLLLNHPPNENRSQKGSVTNENDYHLSPTPFENDSH
jgi:oligopeptidase B